MEKIRIGNDIEIQWAIYSGKGVNWDPYNLTGRRLSLFLKSPYGKREIFEFSTEGNIVKWTFLGKEQRHTGVYSLILIENEGKEGMHTVDECNAFTLVKHSCEVGGGSADGRVETVHLKFRTSLNIGLQDAQSVIIDDELSLESENTIQNKVVTEAIQQVSEKVIVVEKIVKEVTESLDTVTAKINWVEVQ